MAAWASNIVTKTSGELCQNVSGKLRWLIKMVNNEGAANSALLRTPTPQLEKEEKLSNKVSQLEVRRQLSLRFSLHSNEVTATRERSESCAVGCPFGCSVRYRPAILAGRAA